MFDFNDFKKFKSQFSAGTNAFDDWLNEFVIRKANTLVGNIKQRTPVDTGELRKAWTFKYTPNGNDLDVTIINNKEYASLREYGHAKPYKSGALPGSPDWVAGSFMLTISVQEFVRELPAQFDKEFTTFLKSMGMV